MNGSPAYSHYISGTKVDMDNGNHEILSRELPFNRKGVDTEDPNPITYGDYFRAATEFLSRDGGKHLQKAADSLSGSTETISKVVINLEKHGEFYHPARIDVTTKQGNTYFLVLNLAASPSGCAVIKKEFQRLELLSGKYENPGTPAVYNFGEIDVPGKRPLSMFTGEWFSGFYEFHLSQKDCEYGSTPDEIVVWDTENGSFYLSPEERKTLYSKAAEILTSCYDPESFEQVFPWHHAAGDFIVKRTEAQVDLRLITVRQYAPMINCRERDPETILEALVLYLVNLTIRMRLDRMDGIGELAWAPADSVLPTLKGFFKALDSMEIQDIPDFSSPLFHGYLLHIHSRESLKEMADQIAGRPDSPDYPVIKANLAQHMDTLWDVLENFTDET